MESRCLPDESGNYFSGLNVTWQITLYVIGRVSGGSFRYLRSGAAVEHV